MAAPAVLSRAARALLLLFAVSCTREARMRLHADWTKNPKDLCDYGRFLIANRPRDVYLDFDEGIRYLERAAQAGYPEAMVDLGAWQEAGGDPKRWPMAVQWYTRAAEAGDRRAMLALENACRYGRLGLPIDSARADGWLARRLARERQEEDDRWAPLKDQAMKGDLKAMVAFARVCEARGEADRAEALAWFVRAAESGSPEASMRLVQAYREGELGLSRDEEKADAWFRRWQKVVNRPSAG